MISIKSIAVTVAGFSEIREISETENLEVAISIFWQEIRDAVASLKNQNSPFFGNLGDLDELWVAFVDFGEIRRVKAIRLYLSRAQKVEFSSIDEFVAKEIFF